MLPLMHELPLVRSPPISSTWSVPLTVPPVLLTKGWFLVISDIFRALKVQIPFVPSAEHSTSSTALLHANCP